MAKDKNEDKLKKANSSVQENDNVEKIVAAPQEGDSKKLAKQKAREEKTKAKLAKINSKQKIDSDKKKMKVAKTEKLSDDSEPLTSREKRHKIQDELREAANKKLKKPVKDKIDWKRTFREFPASMIKEVSKIRWGTLSQQGFKFGVTIIFLAFSAVFLFLVDWGLQELFWAIKVL